MQTLPIVDEALVKRFHAEASKVWNSEKHTALISVASARAENVEQFDGEMLTAFMQMARWCMYERNFRRASLLLEKAWGSLIEHFPDNRKLQLEALWMLKECYVRLGQTGCAADALRAAMVVMQDCIDRRDAFALTTTPYSPRRFSDNILQILKAKKSAEYAKLSRRVRDIERTWNLVTSTMERPID